MVDYDYPMVIQALSEDEGGGYLAFAPDLHGCVADGDNPEGAIADLRLAIMEWIEEATRLNRDVPKPGDHVARALKEQQKVQNLILRISFLCFSFTRTSAFSLGKGYTEL